MHDRGEFKSYSPADGFIEGTVTVIHEDNAGAVWVGTVHGLSRFANGRFVSLTHSNGLPGNRLTAVVEDADGLLWLGDGSTLIRFSSDEFDRAVGDASYRIHYSTVDASDGFEGVLTFYGTPTAARNDTDGTLWFVTTDGVAVVDQQRLTKHGEAPAPLIERVTADERSFPPAQRIGLPAGTAQLRIDYTSLSLTAPSKIRFRYMLEGFDKNWVNAGTERRARYTNLPPGSYRFRVGATNDDTAWSESGATWAFSIRPAFYQTSWFYAASSATLVLVGWCIWRLRLQRVRKEFSLVLAERMRLAREMHDTLLQGMVGVALQLHGISQTLDPGPAKESCERAGARLEHYTREARRSILDLRSTVLERQDLATALRVVGETITNGSGLAFELSVRGKPRSFRPSVEEHLLRIGQEAISNVVRHAQATQVRVELTYDGDSLLRLRVSDDGQGFDARKAVEENGIHWGLRSMRERAQQLGGRLTLTSTVGVGTAVEIVAQPSPK